MKRILPALFGIPFVGLVLASILVLNDSPGTDKSGAIILQWYSTHKTITNVSALLGVIGIIFGIAFFANLVKRMRETSPGLAIAAFGGAIIFAISGALSYGTDFAFTDTPASGKISSIMSPSTAQVLNYINSDVSYALVCAGLGVFFLAAGTWLFPSGARPASSSVLSRVWSVLTILTGLAATSVFLGFAAFIGIGVWVLVMSVTLTLAGDETA